MITNNNEIITKTRGVISPSQLQVGDEVITHEHHWRAILEIREKSSDSLYEIAFKNSKLKAEVSADQLIYTLRGWIRADELNEKDDKVGVFRGGIVFEYLVNVQPVSSNEDNCYEIYVEEESSLLVSGLMIKAA